MQQDPPPLGVDKRPFIEVTGHEEADYNRWSSALKYAAFGAIAIVGVRWASTVKFQIDPEKFKYLSAGLNQPGETPWYEVRGKQKLANGKIEATIGDFALEITKGFEELFGGIPRTFNIHSFLSRQITTSPTTKLRIPGWAIEGADSHYRSLVGRDLFPEERLYGFQVAPFSEADLENYVRSQAARNSITLSDQAVKDEVAKMKKAGLASPGKAVGMFSVDENGALKELVTPDVNVTERVWDPGGPKDPTTGRSKYRHVMRETDSLVAPGVTPISHTNEFRHMVYKTPTSTRLSDTTREVVEAFIDPKIVENAADSVLGQKGRAFVQEADLMAKSQSERYLRMMDAPLETIEDVLGKKDLFAGVRKTKSYSFLKNMFGTGGDYSGSTADLWARHAKRIVPIALGVTAAYELGSRVTEAFSDKSLAQVGGSAIGATQRIYASISDKLGLTSLNKAQEKEAEGSHRLLGVLAFPLAGGLTGATIASLTNPIVAEPGKTAWMTAREEIHELPDAMSALKKDLPIVGDLSKPMTRAKKFGLIGAAIGGAMSLPFLLGSLGSNKNYDEVVAEQRGETEVAVRKGAFWEMGRTDIEGEETQYYRPNWFARLMDSPTDELQFGDYADRPFTRMLKSVVDPYWREKEQYYERPYPITGPDTSGFGPLGTLWGMTIGRVMKPPKIMHEDELSSGGREGVSSGEVIRFGKNVSEAPSEALGGLGPGLAASPYDQSFLAGEMAYKATEASGLPGFVFSAVKKAITGTPDFGADGPVLASFADVGSMRDQFWDLNVGGGFTTCFIQGTPIKTSRGNIPIEEIQIGDFALSQDGAYRKVIDLIRRTPMADLISISTRSTGSRITCTKTHNIPIVRRHEYRSGHKKPFTSKNIDTLEVEAKDIQIGDLLYYQIDLTESDLIADLHTTERTATSRWIYSTASYEYARAYELLESDSKLTRRDLRAKGIPDKIAKEVLRQFKKGSAPMRHFRHLEINEEIAYLVGWYIAEGCVSGGNITFTMHANEIAYAEILTNTFKKLGIKTNINIQENTLRLEAYDSYFGRYLKIFGSNARDKCIPIEYKQLPKSILSKLTEALILGDGWDGGFTSSSRTLTRDLFDCLLKLNRQVYAVFDYLEIPSGNYPQGSPRQPTIRHYLEFREGRQKWKFFDNAYLIEVTGIDDYDQKVDTVYDLTIEGIHYYTADGIRVHNTEALRRFIPKERFQLDKVNPIRNEMPSWMPGPENYIDFTHGDPYQAVQEGEYRLPGSGYESRFKELAGVSPEDYPDIHKYRILGDIAPFSEQFKDVSKKVEGLASSGKLSEKDMALYEGTKAELQERSQKIKFREEPESLIGKYWAGITKAGRMNPVEHLLPISPVHKFAGPVDAITEYEDRNLYSTRTPSWDSPMEDFIKPALYNAAHALGYEGVPDSVQEKRDLTEYFDKLEYTKYKRLEANARGQGEGRAAFAYARKAEYTMFGADPYMDMDTVKKVLPREELPFFEQFVSSDSTEEKGRILEMVPKYTRKFYTAQWQKQIYAGLAAKGDLTSDEEMAVSAIESSRAMEGEATNTNTWNEYIGKVGGEAVRSNTFPDYIRAKKLESYFDESPFDAPKADWIGYDPAVTMDDVKLKVVQAQGLDFHDFDLWESDIHSAARKPYLNEAASDLMSPTIMREDILQSLTALRMNDLNVEIVPTTGDQTRFTLDVGTNRRKELDREMQRYNR